MDVAYGIKVQESGDRYISIAEEVLDKGNEATIPGAFWVDFFPILAYVPSWFPGAGFQKKAAYCRNLNKIMIETPFRFVQEQLVGESFSWTMNLFLWWFCKKIGTAASSVAANLIEQLPDEEDPRLPMEVKIAQNVATMAYLGSWSCKCIVNH